MIQGVWIVELDYDYDPGYLIAVSPDEKEAKDIAEYEGKRLKKMVNPTYEELGDLSSWVSCWFCTFDTLEEHMERVG